MVSRRFLPGWPAVRSAGAEGLACDGQYRQAEQRDGEASERQRRGGKDPPSAVHLAKAKEHGSGNQTGQEGQSQKRSEPVQPHGRPGSGISA
ncbi:hypothetical protein SPHV1_30034 [Novosphingobium sp. KN65.2]|nr:hypothetical protein SPHV1_30034 [Novosphingobium sp. KN65.2]